MNPFNPTPKVNCQYGAPMGRRSRFNLDTSSKLYLRIVPLDCGGYDKGGAYWGIGQPLYVAIDQEGECYFFRANSRAKAKAHIWQEIDNLARFYN